MKIKSNAKLNLFLKVVGKSGNLHKLESLMVPIDLYDYIEIKESDEDKIIGMDIPIEQNLMYKALCKVRDLYNVNKYIEIKIEKNIPVFAGMGGGSGNAASIILALNKLWDLKMSNEEMLSIGKQIGSDVPFFIINKPAFVSGTGDKIVEKNEFSKIKGLLVYDGDRASTKEVFERLDNMPISINNRMDKSIDKIYENANKNLSFIYNSIYNIEYINDLEKGLDLMVYSKIQNIKNELMSHGAVYSLMTGSGGCVFGIFENDTDVEKCRKALFNKYKFVYSFESI